MSTPVRVVAAGVGLRGDGYPNAVNTMRLLAGDGAFQVEDRVKWLPDGVHLWRLARGTFPSRARLVAWLLLGNLWSLGQVIYRCARQDVLVYVPYPAIFFLWWASWIPARWRPRIIADAYLSIWDTVFRDRDRTARQGKGFPGSVVRAIETRAFRAAALTLTDTVANRDWMRLHFGLATDKTLSLPLALGLRPPAVDGLSRQVPRDDSAPLRILFVGTMVPLHGAAVIADCLEQLKEDTRFHFTLVGDGQEAAVIERALSPGTTANVDWHREWLSADAVRAYVRQADVCLGAFGGQGKAARVLPFKVYMALAEGRVVLTQRLMSVPQGVPEPPCIMIEPCSDALVAALRRLAEDPQALVALGQRAGEFHHQWLGDNAILETWRVAVRRLTETR